jgi:hypothetical protein
MKQKTKINFLIGMAIFGLLWVFNFWPLTEEQRQHQADKVAYAEYIDYVIEVQRTVAQRMKKELHLLCSGSRGRMHEKVEEMGLEFIAYRRATIEEARALQLYVMEGLLQAINEHEKLKPFLEESPFTYKQVKVSISFEGPNGRYSDGTVGTVWNVPDFATEENKNTMIYRTRDPLTGNHHVILKESYKNAIQLAQAFPLENLKTHQTTPLEAAIDEVLPKFTDDVAKSWGFECWSIGGKMSDKVETVEARFTVIQHATQDEARNLALLTTEKLLEAINSDAKLRPYLEEHPFPSNRIKMRIEFRKSNYYSYSDGSTKSVYLKGDELSYFQNPQAGVDPYNETYQEAKVKNYHFTRLEARGVPARRPR